MGIETCVEAASSPATQKADMARVSKRSTIGFSPRQQSPNSTIFLCRQRCRENDSLALRSLPGLAPRIDVEVMRCENTPSRIRTISSIVALSTGLAVAGVGVEGVKVEAELVSEEDGGVQIGEADPVEIIPPFLSAQLSLTISFSSSPLLLWDIYRGGMGSR